MMKYEKSTSRKFFINFDLAGPRCLSNQISVDIFSTIAEKVNTSENIRQLLGVSAKQYYMRQSYLMKTGLIERRQNVLLLQPLDNWYTEPY